MSLNKLLIALVILICPFLVPNSAQASSISLMAVDNFSQNTSTIVSGTNGKNLGSQNGFGGGGLVDFPFAQKLGFETGFLFFDRNWSDTNGANSLVSQTYEIPAMFKLHFLGAVSLGVGGYYAFNSGNLGETGTITNSALTYSNYGLNPYDYGLRGELDFHVPLSMAVNLRIDVAYDYGLSNAATASGNTFNYRSAQILAGLQFMLGSERHK